MANFKYSAVGSDGRTISGSLAVDNHQAAVEELRRRNLMPLKIEEKGGRVRPEPNGRAAPSAPPPSAGAPPGPKKGLFSMDISFGGAKPGVRKKDETVLFTRQLSTLIGAGIPLLESMEILRDQAESRQFGMLLDRVIDDVRSGQDLSSSLNKFPKVFSNVYVSMIRAGEASGQLDDILVRLAEYMEATQRLKRDIKSAMTYPVVSLVMIFGITAFLMIAIVPKFKEVFTSLDVELPGLTKFILKVSDFCQEQWAIMIAGFVVVIMLIKIYKKTEKGSRHWDWLVLHLPVFGPLFRKVGLSRFSKTFATMLKSGVPILGALEIVSETAGNRLISDAIDDARDSVREGESLAKPLADSGMFPPMVTRMIGVGEKTGALEALLDKVSEFYDEQVRATVKQLTSLIEPIMIAVMGVMVGTICLSVFLPIFELQKQLAHR
jgi:type IV pilus assembly protein PilC